MPWAPKIAELRKLTDAELEQLYDRSAAHVQVGVTFILDEIRRREAERQGRTMLRLTWAIFGFTLVVTLATLAMLVRGWGAA